MSAWLSYVEELDREERLADESAARWADRHPNPEPPPPARLLQPRDGDLLLIGKSGACDEKGYAVLFQRYGRRAA